MTAGSGVLSRRKLIALVGGIVAAVLGVLYGWLPGVDTGGGDPPNGTADPTEVSLRPTPTPTEPTEESNVPRDAESISDYGAEPNPDDPSLAAARQNLDAILAAADAAGKGGAIHVPEGEYYFGSEDSGFSPYVEFGKTGPPGVSIIGAGADKSTLAITRHASADTRPNQSAFIWYDGYEHGSVEIKDIKLDGNYESVTGLAENGGGSWGLQMSMAGDFHLERAWIRGWHLAGVRGRAVLRSVRNCTFQDNGIGRHNETDGRSNSHHISVRPQAGDELIIENSCFLDCAGNAVNIRFGDGVTRMHNCFVRGTGSGLCKMSAGKVVELKNIYHRANTPSLERKVDKRDIGPDFHGRFFINNLGNRGTTTTTVIMENVLSRDMADYAFQAQSEIGNGPMNVIWTGDMIEIYNTNRARDDAVIRDHGEGRFSNIDISRLSVHSSNAKVFMLDDSQGDIETFSYSDTDGLGDAGDVSINVSDRSQELFRPTVPTIGEVGVGPLDPREG
ncbi:chitin-binding protein [Haloarcula japonica]|uniref:chitin-binding protein n=1 Tax=Haloarcula japonica TaxID=29282 RepID=UPI0039F6A565